MKVLGTNVLIKSQFKDYYDHVAYIYGGGDPSIQYIRNRLSPLDYSDGSVRSQPITVPSKGIPKLPQYEYFLNYYYKWLAVCGKLYLIIQTQLPIPNGKSEYILFSEKDHPVLWDDVYKNRKRRSPYGSRYDSIGQFSENVLELSRKLNAPVFSFGHSFKEGCVDVDSEIPILGKIGFASIMSPEQLYQELSYFMGNVIKESPDVMPETKMTDKEKILGHGFDNRISFRHRV